LKTRIYIHLGAVVKGVMILMRNFNTIGQMMQDTKLEVSKWKQPMMSQAI